MRWSPLIVALVFLAICAAWLAVQAPHRAAFQPYSSYDASPTGTSQLRAYLGERAGRTVRSLFMPFDLARLPPRGAVLRIAPIYAALGAAHHPAGASEAPPTPSAMELLDAVESDWVSAGGTMILAIDAPWGGIELEEVGPAGAGIAKSFPALPGVAHLAGGQRAMAGGALGRAVTIFSCGDGAAVARIDRGAGRIWVLACPEIFTNSGLGKDDNLALVLGMLPADGPVLFDEFVHGQVEDAGLLVLLHSWGLGPCLLLLAGTFAAWFWRRRVGVGPRDLPPPPPPGESVDGLQAIGALYGRVLGPAAALDGYRERLVRRLEEVRRHARRQTAGDPSRLYHAWRNAAKDPGPRAFAVHLRRLNRVYRSLRDEFTRRRP